MRLVACVLLVVAACTQSDDPPDAPVTVRERLVAAPTALVAAPADTVGQITVRRRVLDGWQEAVVDLAVTGGDLVVSADATGAVSIDRLELAIGSYELPLGDDSIELVDIRASLAAPARADAVWTDDNTAAFATTAALRVTWSIAIDDRVTPLGDLWPPAMPLDATLAGDAARVDATVALAGEGTLWSWAGLVELADLSLVVDAATVD